MQGPESSERIHRKEQAVLAIASIAASSDESNNEQENFSQAAVQQSPPKASERRSARLRKKKKKKRVSPKNTLKKSKPEPGNQNESKSSFVSQSRPNLDSDEVIARLEEITRSCGMDMDDFEWKPEDNMVYCKLCNSYLTIQNKTQMYRVRRHLIGNKELIESGGTTIHSRKIAAREAESRIKRKKTSHSKSVLPKTASKVVSQRNTTELNIMAQSEKRKNQFLAKYVRSLGANPKHFVFSDSGDAVLCIPCRSKLSLYHEVDGGATAFYPVRRHIFKTRHSQRVLSEDSESIGRSDKKEEEKEEELEATTEPIEDESNTSNEEGSGEEEEITHNVAQLKERAIELVLALGDDPDDFTVLNERQIHCKLCQTQFVLHKPYDLYRVKRHIQGDKPLRLAGGKTIHRRKAMARLQKAKKHTTQKAKRNLRTSSYKQTKHKTALTTSSKVKKPKSERRNPQQSKHNNKEQSEITPKKKRKYDEEKREQQQTMMPGRRSPKTRLAPKERAFLRAQAQGVKEMIRLDVGGHRYTTTTTTLSRYPGSMLACIQHGTPEIDKDGFVFIDRDGTHFGLILNWLRTYKPNKNKKKKDTVLPSPSPVVSLTLHSIRSSKHSIPIESTVLDTGKNTSDEEDEPSSTFSSSCRIPLAPMAKLSRLPNELALTPEKLVYLIEEGTFYGLDELVDAARIQLEEALSSSAPSLVYSPPVTTGRSTAVVTGFSNSTPVIYGPASALDIANNNSSPCVNIPAVMGMSPLLASSDFVNSPLPNGKASSSSTRTTFSVQLPNPSRAQQKNQEEEGEFGEESDDQSSEPRETTIITRAAGTTRSGKRDTGLPRPHLIERKTKKRNITEKTGSKTTGPWVKMPKTKHSKSKRKRVDELGLVRFDKDVGVICSICNRRRGRLGKGNVCAMCSRDIQ